MENKDEIEEWKKFGTYDGRLQSVQSSQITRHTIAGFINVYSTNRIDVATSKRACFAHYIGSKIGYIS